MSNALRSKLHRCTLMLADFSNGLRVRELRAEMSPLLQGRVLWTDSAVVAEPGRTQFCTGSVACALSVG